VHVTFQGDSRTVTRLRWALGCVAVALVSVAVALMVKWFQGLPPYGIAFSVIAWRVAWSLGSAAGAVVLAVIPMQQRVRMLCFVVACAIAGEMLLSSRAWLADVTGWPERHAVQQAERLSRRICGFEREFRRPPSHDELSAMVEADERRLSYWTHEGRRVEFKASGPRPRWDQDTPGDVLDVGEIACEVDGGGAVQCVVGVPSGDSRGHRVARRRTGDVAVARANACR
jgi:hypothetical protein